MKTLDILVYNNDNKKFKVEPEVGKSVLHLVNKNYDHPKQEGIPFLCLKGTCRACVIKVETNEYLLEPPNKGENMSLSVGKTAIDLGYRLSCLAKFK